MESKKKFYLEAPVKVHTYDTDYMGIVSNTVYPKYFEDLRNAILDQYWVSRKEVGVTHKV